MKLRNIVVFALLFSLFGSQAAYAIAFRTNPRMEVEVVSRSKPNDIIFQDFSSVEPGSFPTGLIVNAKSDAGYSTTEVHDIGGGVKKNCGVMVDTSNDRNYTGPGITVNCPPTSGIVGIEARYKFVKSDPGNTRSFAGLVVYPQGSTGSISRSYLSSGGGSMTLNYGESDTTIYCSDPLVPDEWWTMFYVIDTNAGKLDVQLRNEANGKVYQCFDNDFYLNDKSKSVTGFSLRSEVFSGTWIIDYVRFTKEETRLVPYIDDDPSKPKGKEYVPIDAPSQNLISGRTNVKLNGKYKYTTKAPKVNGENVLVTAKNIATMFDMAYYTSASEITIKGDNVEFVIAKDGSYIKNGKDNMNLSASGIAEGNQIFVPIKDLAEAMGFAYEYDAANNVVNINSAE